MPISAEWFGFKVHGTVVRPGYSIFLVPWAGSKSNTGWATRSQDSLSLGGGYLNSGVQNDEVTWDAWFDLGTYKYAMLHLTNLNVGIYSVQIDAVAKGTIDGYTASAVRNVYTELTGVTFTAGLKNFKLKMATKNGSASGYVGATNTASWIRTGA